MPTIEDDLEKLKDSDVIDDDRSESYFSIKRFAIISTSFIVALIMLSYLLFGGISFGPVSSMIRSDKVRDNVLSTHGFEVVFEGETLEKSIKTWNDNPDVESPLCFHGEVSGSTYYVDFAYEPEIIEQSYTHIRHEPCDEESILSFHTHPYKRCIASQADIDSLRNGQRRNPDMAMLIMCDENRFSLYY